MLKVKMYLLSLVFLWISIIIVVSFPNISDLSKCFPFDKDNFHTCVWNTISVNNWQNYLALLCILVSIYSLIFYKKKIVSVKIRNGSHPYKISKIAGESTEYITFLSTYIMPLAFIDISTIRGVLNLSVMLVVIGFIQIKFGKIYSNPTLALFGIRPYKADLIIWIDKDKGKFEKKNNVILLSLDDLSLDDEIFLVNDKDSDLFFAKKKIKGEK